MQTIAAKLISYCYESPEGDYYRPTKAEIRREFGGRIISSSNDDSSTWSFSPDDIWEFPDGSRATVSYCYAAVEPEQVY